MDRGVHTILELMGVMEGYSPLLLEDAHFVSFSLEGGSLR